MDVEIKNIYGKTKNKKINVTVPGSKSITSRALMISALAMGNSVLHNAQLSDDSKAFMGCLKNLGIDCRVRGTTVKIKGCGGRVPAFRANINVGSSGTAARFFPALLSLRNGEFTIDASDQMKARPIEPLLNSLRGLGAEIISTNGTFPLTVRGEFRPKNNTVEVDITKSSQFLSALLIAGGSSARGLNIVKKGNHGMDYINLTLKVMEAFGVPVYEDNGVYEVCGRFEAKKYDIEPDVSAACYFYAANRILGTNINVKGIPTHSIQGDMKFIEFIKKFDGGFVDMGSFSDQALTLAAIAPYFRRSTHICNVAHIRGQECDRIKAITHNLRAMGVRCDESADGVVVFPATPRPAKIETFGDHRVAMAFALTGLRADGIVIKNAEVCSKTFPGYFDVLNDVCRKLT